MIFHIETLYQPAAEVPNLRKGTSTLKTSPLRDAFPVPPFARVLGIPGIFILVQIFPPPSNHRSSRPFPLPSESYFPTHAQQRGVLDLPDSGVFIYQTEDSTPKPTSLSVIKHTYTHQKRVVDLPISGSPPMKSEDLSASLSVRKIVASHMCMCICPGRGDCSRDST